MDGKVAVRVRLDGVPEYSAGMETLRKEHASLGTSTKQAAQAMRMLPAQLSDVATQLQGGASPLTVLMQQGLQTKDMFGGFKPMFAGIAAAVTPAVVGIGAAVAATGALGYVMVSGQREAAVLRDALAMTGNAAGLTREQFDALNKQVAENAVISMGAAREVATGLVASGQVSSQALSAVATAAARVAEVSDKSTDEVTADFAGMSQGVTDWAVKHNKAWHFATADQIDYIKALDQSGQKQEAMVQVSKLLTSHLEGQSSQLGLLERAWKGVTTKMGEYAELARSIGRPETTADRIKDINARMAEIQRRSAGYSPDWDGVAINSAKKEMADMQRQLHDLGIEQSDAAKRAGNKGAAAAEAQVAIARRTELTAVTQRLSGANQQYIKDLQTITDSAAAGEISEKQRLELLTEAANKYGTQAKARKDPTAAQQESAYEKMVRETLKNRAPRLAEIEAKGYAGANAAAEANMAAQLEFVAKRNEEADRLGQDYARASALLNINLIADDRQRGQAQIELERQTAQAKLDALAQLGADTKAAQDELNQYLIAKQKELNEQLKPQWQRNLEAWQDKNKLMQTSFDDAMGNMQRNGEDAFVQFAATGKLSVKGLVDGLLADFARLQFRESLAPLLASGGKGLLGALGLGAGAPAAGGDGAKALVPAAKAVTDAAQSFDAPAQGLESAGQSLLQSALGWLFPQAAQTTSAATLGVAAQGLMSAAGALSSAAAALSAGGGGGGGGGGLWASLFEAGASAAAATGAMVDGRGWHAATAFAAGGAFGKGEVLTQPTLFRFRQAGAVRMGLAGEAGPEAALPLRNGGVLASVAGRAVGALPLKRQGGVLGVDLTAFTQSGPVAAFADGGAFGGGGASASVGQGGAGARPAVQVQQTLVFHGDGVQRGEMAKFAKQVREQTEASVFDKLRRGRRV